MSPRRIAPPAARAAVLLAVSASLVGGWAGAQPPAKGKAAPPPKPLKNDALLDKAMNRYDYTPRVSATVTVALPGRKSATTDEAEGVTIQARVVNDAKGFMTRSRFAFSAPADVWPVAEGEWVFLDDGKQLHTLYPKRKEFASAPRKAERFSSLFRPTVQRIRDRGVTFRSSEATVGGKPVYLLQGKSIDGFSAQVVIDRATLNLESILVATPTGRVVNQITFSDQQFMPDLPASTFEKPADYKPFQE
jgi:hypothetical protein